MSDQATFLRFIKSPLVLLFTAMLIMLVGIVFMMSQCRYMAWILLVAYVSCGLVALLERKGMSSTWASVLVTTLITGLVAALCAGLVPLLFIQATAFVEHMPEIISSLSAWLNQLGLSEGLDLSYDHMLQILRDYAEHVTSIGGQFVMLSYHTLENILYVSIITLISPFILFFLLRDRRAILSYLDQRFIPHAELVSKFFVQVNEKMGSYLRGKLIEASILASAMFLLFEWFGLDFALMLSFLVGASVFIPIFGLIVASIPVIILALSAWGLSNQLWLFSACFSVLIVLDSNFLVPLLFSQRLGLHPLPILIAILLFGQLFGFWGMLLAIPILVMLDVLIELIRGYTNPAKA